ncbi:IclR family transcriptional regulator [Streptacidiphilus jiangxiensis]|uniref:Glycerol operon regulatory protein n=1 Tax=Streptacidiphilus jiangxiensis TaxID=235985 RepID=A0A1H7J7Y7_STRJI|nr:helix-turn-helix domain-containing protein [Streptacidiphilus jiangxiensis]SEK70883.1 DNA-binding transcriptional regulator, IclR family [Streptacidiphilus jiangxiensis]
MATEKAAPTLIGSVQRALRLLEAVGEHREGATAKQLARKAGLPLGTTYHLLRTLTHEGYLERVDGIYVHGKAVGSLGRHREVRQGREAVSRALNRLREELGAATYFATYRDGEVEVVDVSQAPGTEAVEEWADFGATGNAHAIGQCLLGQLDREGRLDYFSRHRPQSLTRRTVTDSGVLMRRLEARPLGRPVLEQQEYMPGVVCAAVPIMVGAAVCTIALSLPVAQSHRLPAAADRLGARVGSVMERLSFTI